MVARGRPGLRSTGDPTSHAVMSAIREAARRLGRPSLAGVTLFCVVEPCTMCVGRAPGGGRRRPRVRAGRPGPGRLRLGRPAGRPAAEERDGFGSCPGILAQEAAGPSSRPRGGAVTRPRPELAPRPGAVGLLCYALARRGVRVVDGAALEKRCAKAPRVRIPPSPPSPFDSDTIGRSSSRPRRGRLVAEGAALEMRYGATHRGFESLPLRQLPAQRPACVLAGHGRYSLVIPDPPGAMTRW